MTKRRDLKRILDAYRVYMFGDSDDWSFMTIMSADYSKVLQKEDELRYLSPRLWRALERADTFYHTQNKRKLLRGITEAYVEIDLADFVRWHYYNAVDPRLWDAIVSAVRRKKW